MLRTAARTLAALLLLAPVSALAQQGLPTQTWPAGTQLADWPHGGRITTFHRGQLYLGGTENQNTWVYDISNPQSPQLLCTGPAGLNGHAWQKVGDLFYRQYWNPEVGSDPPAGTSQFVSLVDPCNRVPWTAPIPGFPHLSPVWGGWFMDTFPWVYANNIYDARVGWWPIQAPIDVRAVSGLNVGNRFRLGNLLFLTPGDDQTGVAVFDIGNPTAPVLLDVLAGNYRQYTTAWQVWRHYLVMMNGDNLNGPDANANALVIDFSDPTNLQLAFTIPYNDLPGRYVHFQDDYAFAGRFNRGTKYNMVTRQVERVFTPVSGGYSDFQWIPLGHLVLASGSETNGSRSYLYAHQNGLDTTPPTLAYHLPADGATNQPLTSAIGLVIHERLQAETVNDSTIQLRPLGGEPLPTVVVHTSYDVINVVPNASLLPDTTYEVRFVANGVRDLAGNAMAPVSFFFSTGDSVAVSGPPEITLVSSNPVSPASVGQPVQFSVTASDPGGGALEYRWNFGDGSPATAWSASNQITRSYAAPGNYTVLVQARRSNGELAGATLPMVVQPVAAAQPGRGSSSILVDGAARRVWSLNPDHGSVAVIDADSLQRLAIHAACANPRSLARDGAGRSWIACADADRLIALDGSGNQVAQLDTGRGSAPEAVLFDHAGNGYASLAAARALIRFNPNTAAETGRIALPAEPGALALAGDRLYAARLLSGDAAGTVWSVALPAFSAASELALALDTTTADSGTAARGLPNYLASLAPSPDNARLWYAAKKDNILRGLLRDGAELDFETMVRVLVGGIDTGAQAESLPARQDIDNSALALALASAPGGAQLFVALAGNDRVLALDPWQGRELARVDVGAAPRGLAVDAATGRVFVRNDLGRSVSVLDAASLMSSGTAALPVLATVATVTSEVLPAPVLAGKRTFFRAEDTRMSADGYLACASCHLDGDSDGRVWDFAQRGEGLRRSIALRGRAGMGHGPVHWSANFDEIQDFESDIREVFGGTGLMGNAHYFAGTRDTPLGDAKAGLSADLDNLAAYVSSLDRFGLSPRRQADGALTAEAATGRSLFADLGCAGCHGGAAFTDSALLRFHDVGTLTADSGLRLAETLQGLDTPTLRGLWREPRFLHDGRATDLAAVLVGNNPSGAHGAVAGLAAGQRAALFAYLLSIDDDEPAVATPFALALTGIAPNGQADPALGISLGIATDLAGIVRVDYLDHGNVVASALAPPWQAHYQPVAGAPLRLQVRVQHASGAITTTWPMSASVHALAGGVFSDSFEAR
jgi:large repetitive protein